VAVEHRHTFAADAEHCARLRALRNLEIVLAIHGGHTNFGAHRRLCNRDRHYAMQIVALPCEEWMFFHMKNDVEIAGWSAKLADFPGTCKANARSVFHARRNLGIYRSLTEDAALAFALGARIGDHVARSLAGWASTSNTEEALLISNLPAAIA
jgi:hypothetical protein